MKKTKPDIEWVISNAPIDYNFACDFMKQRADEIRLKKNKQLVWLLEHPSIYTAGTSANPKELLTPKRFKVYNSGRGGRYTYHGPGQRVAYVLLDLKLHGNDVRLFISLLEKWLIKTLGDFNIIGQKRSGVVGVWANKDNFDSVFSKMSKIGSIGIRIKKWVSFHGISLNIEPTLEHFNGIISCGINDSNVTSMHDLGLTCTMEDVDIALRKNFEDVFECKTVMCD